jgi:hypothetical protein
VRVEVPVATVQSGRVLEQCAQLHFSLDRSDDRLERGKGMDTLGPRAQGPGYRSLDHAKPNTSSS